MDLGLAKITKKEFEFLILNHGFKCIKADPWLVKYQSELVFINIRFDGKRSYELTCEIGRNNDFRGTLKAPINIDEIIRSKEYSKKNVRAFFQVTSSHTLIKIIKKLAGYLKVYAQDLLTGSNESFNAVADFRDKESEKYAIETELTLMRNQLDIAWKSKNYKKIIYLLTPLKRELAQSELKKLDYALKKINMGN